MSLPFGAVMFDVVYCFSIFTHLSPRALSAALSAIRSRIAPAGLLVVTIRPIEFWAYAEKMRMPIDRKAMEAAHAAAGFAFTPSGGSRRIGGEATYGDASMTLEYLASHPDWQIAGSGHIPEDPFQLPVFLRPV